MEPTNKGDKEKIFLYAFYIKGDSEYVLKMGEKSFEQGMKPHYQIEVLRNIGDNTKMGMLRSYSIQNQKWLRLREANITDDSLYSAKQESLSELHFLYIKDSGVWKIDGLDVDKESTTIQISRVEQKEIQKS